VPHDKEATSMTEDGFDFEGSAQHQRRRSGTVIQDQMTVENVDCAGGAFGGRICDSSVIDKREVAAACTYFGSMPCVESGACAPREVGFLTGQLQTLSHGIRS
jgi:hypothetical protein